MNPDNSAPSTITASSAELDWEVVEREFPPNPNVLYLNTGSCGRKPRRVMDAVYAAMGANNENPTLVTHIDMAPKNEARAKSAELLGVPQELLILTQSTTQGLQLFLQSFLLKAGDELVTTDHEHGSANTIIRYLEETRGIIVRRHRMEPMLGSEHHCLQLVKLISEKTKLVLVSEIDCFTGWRPDLSYLVEGCRLLDIPLLVDGAHSPGNGPSRTRRYPMWVGSAHKWLGAPNGTGYAYVSRQLSWQLAPVWLGHKYYEMKDHDEENIHRFELQGTEDMTRWFGLKEACALQLLLSPLSIARRQIALVNYLREQLRPLNPSFRTPESAPESEKTAMLAFHFDRKQMKVDDLAAALWSEHRIWAQPDYINDNIGYGMRISCHYTISHEDIDRFVKALSGFVK
ncbi:MAG TPA: aminotransferase class V-fold PLP-dependent enzyme [Candidatus Obscuribacterales bacterium]